MKPIIAAAAQLLESEDPSIRYKAKLYFLGHEQDSAEIQQLRSEIKGSPRARMMLSERDEDGRIPYNPYAKWYGAHWVLSTR